ncbi:MAG: hypothetical protein BWY76_02154 [bacterium ADurb.Bin429]|nr:MAG: hypothetical protein BWY76_02154 [bacterium ADurb.Bin429]
MLIYALPFGDRRLLAFPRARLLEHLLQQGQRAAVARQANAPQPYPGIQPLPLLKTLGGQGGDGFRGKGGGEQIAAFHAVLTEQKIPGHLRGVQIVEVGQEAVLLGQRPPAGKPRIHQR